MLRTMKEGLVGFSWREVVIRDEIFPVFRKIIALGELSDGVSFFNF